MDELLNNLNQKQREAVTTMDGPVLVLAGPGSGKTRTLTHKIAYLVSKGVHPKNILAVTFTNKAAKEMKQRVSDLIKKGSVSLDAPPTVPTVGTFHSICARWLRENASLIGRTPSFIIYDAEDSTSLIKKIVKDMDLDTKQFSHQKVKGQISKAKDFLITPDMYEEDAKDHFQRQVAKIYTEYQSKLKQNDALDFDDLITQTVLLLQKNPSVLQKYQKRFPYILVDEYQDTNTAQYEWLNLVAKKSKGVCVVGDDAQSIYSWRNANYENILNFKDDWPNAKVIKLEQNYRSAKNIVEASSELIKNNSKGYKKDLWTQNKEGEAIKVYELTSGEEEAGFAVGEIARVSAEHNYKPNDFVVLYRTNAQSRAIEQAFLHYNVPYKIIGGLKFYQRQEVKDVIAFLRLLQNKGDEISHQRLERLKLSDLSAKLPEKPKNKKDAIQYLVEDFRNYLAEAKSLSDITNYIIQKANFEGALRDETDKGEERWQNVQELLSAVQKYEDTEPKEAIKTFLEDVTLTQEADNVDSSAGVVHLMTLHMAKGLEFPVVFIVGCEEGLLPHANSMWSQKDLEEERRLMYVGLTRAEDIAYILFARSRMIWGETKAGIPSSFLAEIPEKYKEFESLAKDFLEDEFIEL